MELFDRKDIGKSRGKKPISGAPLAERARPQDLTDFVGQSHLLAQGKPLRVLIERDQVPSMIFWGPPGSGKTTLARIIANLTKADFYQLNAVSSGVKDVREVIDKAELNLKHFNRKTILFIDEIHRFNKAQQDALLHSVEEGVLILIGATTENPSFEVISPLLSRCRTYVLEPLGKAELHRILDRVLASDKYLQSQNVVLQDRDFLMLLSAGDARVLLTVLEISVQLAGPNKRGERVITRDLLEESVQRKYAKYDKAGEEHYNIISGFIKSVRGSDPDAGVYWLARMLEGGEDPKFIARRMIILASEDIGNADPFALVLATSCFTAVDYIGMPEAQLVLAQVAAYLASCPKSNSAYIAIHDALSDVRTLPNEPVPMHVRNAPTRLMAELGYGAGYKYSHDFKGHFVEQQFLPDNLKDKIYYHPGGEGAEKSIRDRLNRWWKKRQR